MRIRSLTSMIVFCAAMAFDIALAGGPDVFSKLTNPPELSMTKNLQMSCMGLSGGGIPISVPRRMITNATPDFGVAPMEVELVSLLDEKIARLHKDFGCLAGIRAIKVTAWQSGLRRESITPLCLRSPKERVLYPGHPQESLFRAGGEDMGMYLSHVGIEIPAGITFFCTYNFISYAQSSKQWVPTTIIALPKKLDSKSISASGNWTVNSSSWGVLPSFE